MNTFSELLIVQNVIFSEVKCALLAKQAGKNRHFRG
jgi:hypothetical protein